MRQVIWTLPLMIAPLAQAWHDEGHVYATRAAVAELPDDVPAFFRDGVTTIAHCSLDADVNRNEALPQLSAANAPDHFLDAELLAGRDWPATRYAYFRLCKELDIEPDKAGTLPWAIAEQTQALTVAFAEYRRDPGNPAIEARCLVIAGHLAHFSADLCMPLHTTIHFDGLVSEQPSGGGGKRFKGIHARVDALPTKLPYAVIFADDGQEQALEGVEPERLMQFIKERFDASHALVPRVYELEPAIPAMDDLTLSDEAVQAFTIERMHAAADFTASLYLTAWRNSADLKLPDWLDRSIFDHDFDPTRIPPQPNHP